MRKSKKEEKVRLPLMQEQVVAPGLGSQARRSTAARASH
jgi:hypothetical protein